MVTQATYVTYVDYCLSCVRLTWTKRVLFLFVSSSHFNKHASVGGYLSFHLIKFMLTHLSDLSNVLWFLPHLQDYSREGFVSGQELLAAQGFNMTRLKQLEMPYRLWNHLAGIFHCHDLFLLFDVCHLQLH